MIRRSWRRLPRARNVDQGDKQSMIAAEQPAAELIHLLSFVRLETYRTVRFVAQYLLPVRLFTLVLYDT